MNEKKKFCTYFHNIRIWRRCRCTTGEYKQKGSDEFSCSRPPKVPASNFFTDRSKAFRSPSCALQLICNMNVKRFHFSFSLSYHSFPQNNFCMKNRRKFFSCFQLKISLCLLIQQINCSFYVYMSFENIFGINFFLIVHSGYFSKNSVWG